MRQIDDMFSIQGSYKSLYIFSVPLSARTKERLQLQIMECNSRVNEKGLDIALKKMSGF